ncbi:cobyric acid synthase [Treponema ruminis]|uniref:Cobyric acid synthase n=1 Tax=Treponema ruminis TaxID=744515 RepID=A0A7W8LN46_9SPIR|nr:cobyric acid synthase [Treponema ruminis]MBB5227132.1 cobyric acid synthase CobQ [Treponema ruminis]
MLEFKNLSVGYDQAPLQKPFSLKIERGEIFTLIGPNGSGKSTLLKTLIKELSPVQGSVFFDGKNLNSLSLKDLAKEVSALLTVPVKPELMTCRDVVASGRYPFTGPFALLKEDDEKKIDEAIALVQAQNYAHKDFMKVSDGQKQRIMFARALCQNPRLLVLDEPTSFLDIKWRLELLKILENLSGQGVTVIASMHEIDLALKISHRILCIGKGQISELSRNEAECKNQICALYNLSEEDYNETLYAGLVKKFCERKGEKPPYEHSSPGDSLKTHLVSFCPATRCRSLPPRVQATLSPTPSSPRGNAPKTPKDDSLVTRKDGFANSLMVQGTMSNAGKSFLVAGLCRIFKQDGFSVAPFKSQNMALNSFVTNEGLEMGRAQVMQAEAAGVEPSVLMNPILLKPNSDTGSQVIVNGEVLGDMAAKEYFAFKKNLVPHIMKAYNQLASENQVIVLEGAGSPAEINLKENDIVNMGMAAMADSPVILVADIDRGGVFAQILGTIELLTPEERKRVKGFVINKFRGDKSILDSGITMLEEKTGIPCVGTLPYMKIQLDDEDSLSTNLHTLRQFRDKKDEIQLAIVRLPHISNFTDFIPLQNLPNVNLYYVLEPKDLGSPDCIIIPGTKNTPEDLDWLKKSGLAELIQAQAKNGTPIVGICGGFQMLGEKLRDEETAADEEGRGSGFVSGLSLLPVSTVFSSQKIRTRVSGKVLGGENESEKDMAEKSIFSPLANLLLSGYEIHMGQTDFAEGAEQAYFSQIRDSVSGESKFDGAVSGNVFGTYIHGLFDEAEFCRKFVEMLAVKKGIPAEKWSQISNDAGKSASGMEKSSELAASDRTDGPFSGEKFTSLQDFKESQYNILAETLRKHLDMKKIYEIMGLSRESSLEGGRQA